MHNIRLIIDVEGIKCKHSQQLLNSYTTIYKKQISFTDNINRLLFYHSQLYIALILSNHSIINL